MPTPDSLAPESNPSTALTVPQEEVRHDVYAPSISVIGPDKKKFFVSANAKANRAHFQMISSRVRGLLEKTIKDMEERDEAPDTKELKRIVDIAITVEEMAILAYEGRKPLKPTEASAFGDLAMGLVRAAAEGTAKGTTQAVFDERLRKIRNLGRSKPEATEIEAKAVVEESL